MTRHALSIQNEYTIYLQYLKKEMSDEVDFLQADKHQSFLQVDTFLRSFLMGLVRHAQSDQTSLLLSLLAMSQGRS